MKTRLVVCLLLSVTVAAAQVQDAAPVRQHEANFDSERKEANQLYLAGKILEALPLYEDLCRQDQTMAVFAERHGTGLMRKAGTLPDGPEKKALNDQGMAEYRRAQKLGDNSDLVQTVLSAGAKSMIGTAISGIPLSVGYTYRGNAAAQQPAQAAEIAFNKQDTASALTLYQQAAALDPKWYDPTLFAGDMYFRQGDAANAGLWFAKAIAIDPDRDTAYRYWGDALYKSGKPAEAKVKYEQAVIAEPYGKSAWLSLQAWARATKTHFPAPQVAIPKFNNKDGVPIPDPALDTPTAVAAGLPAWRPYLACRAKQLAANNKFGFSVGVDGTTRPMGAYHTLAEETACLRATLVDFQAELASGTVTPQTADLSLKFLAQLDRDGYLQSWILLNHSDPQDRFDYPAYRKANRDLLLQYLDRVVVPSSAAQ